MGYPKRYNTKVIVSKFLVKTICVVGIRPKTGQTEHFINKRTHSQNKQRNKNFRYNRKSFNVIKTTQEKIRRIK